MGRRRSRQDAQLPPYVYRKRDHWIYRPYLGRENGRTLRGPSVTLCRVGAPMSELFAAYERATGQQRGTLRWLLDHYHNGARFRELRPSTQRDYSDYRRIICSRTGTGGLQFGDVPLDQITPRTIRRYLDTYPAPYAANRHVQYMKAAWNWCAQRLDGVPPNPCLGVQLNREAPRDRYVDQDEFARFKAQAHGYVPLFMELAYLCRARWGEIATLTHADLLADGVRLIRSKGSEGEITAWTPRLREAVAACKAWQADAPAPISGTVLIHDKRGRPIKRNSFQSAWRRAMDKWEKAGGERFAFHDLKAAGISDQKENRGGHRSERMRRVYVRKLPVVEPPA